MDISFSRMWELILILIIVISHGYINTLSFYLLTFFITLVYSKYIHNYRTSKLFVILMILKLLSQTPSLRSLMGETHSILYNSFEIFITTFSPESLTTFLISITVGTAETKLTKDIYYSFKRFNMLHVVSISGANFSLIKSLFEVFKKFIDKRKLYIFIIFIQTYYIFLIGFTNLPALRAYLFTTITLYSSIIGRPISFINKLLVAMIFIININHESLNSMGFYLSIGFSILYKCLELKPLNKIFNTELKKISLVFMISIIIFNSDNPDFIGNLVFSLLYPFIFVFTFLGYIINLFGIKVIVIYEIVLLMIRLILGSLNQLSSTINTYIQTSLFIAILIKIFKSTFKKRNYEYTKFAQ